MTSSDNISSIPSRESKCHAKIDTSSSSTVTVWTPSAPEIARMQALTCYMNFWPFNCFENDWTPKSQRPFLHIGGPFLHIGGPSMEDVAGPLLREARDFVKARIPDCVDSNWPTYSLNLAMEWSRDFAGQWKCACLMHGSAGQLFYQQSYECSESMLHASGQTGNVVAYARESAPNGSKAINSIIMDPQYIGAIQANLSRNVELAHILVVPCQSESLLNLVEDILTLDSFRPIVSRARVLGKIFTSASTCRALRRQMTKDLGSSHAMAIYSFPSWGSKLRYIRALYKARMPICSLARMPVRDSRCALSAPAFQEIASDDKFWNKLSLLDTTLDPIDSAIQCMDSNHTNVFDVRPQWESIRRVMDKLTLQSLHDPHLRQLKDLVNSHWDRTTRSPAIAAAFMLTPHQFTVDLPHQMNSTALTLLKVAARQTGLDPEKVLREFQKLMLEQRHKDNDHARDLSDQKAFYRRCEDVYPAVAKLGLRLTSTPCTSRPGERSVSAIASALNECRHGLDVDGQDTLQFILINERAMANAPPWFATNHDSNTKKLVLKLEDYAIVHLVHDNE